MATEPRDTTPGTTASGDTAPAKTTAPVVTPTLLRTMPLPGPGGDKDGNGRVLVLGGSRRSPGAVRLAGEAVLRAGAGRVTLATIGDVVAGLSTFVPEAGMIPLRSDDDGAIALDADDEAFDELLDEADRADVVLLGPGLVDADHARSLVELMLPRIGGTVLLDALATAHLTDHPDALHPLAERCVVTANVNELARMAGVEEVEGDEQLATTAEVAARLRAVVLCGGTLKHVVDPGGEAWVIEGGGPGLGASGSGDVQAGILAGFLARGASPAHAAVWAGYSHARAGERLAAEVGGLGYLARELPAQVPAVLNEVG
ncbi:NAD(P)H-hydrate dehydratase [Nocardioides sp. zg-ZUI104]|uniref:NAD(P)H-hydrate dehydratase n=1 Tax=Nocardioides faecalis TaxID=2803858 RepID=UPI001BCE44C7|nr:NAD(P)H-hydrate dehydratase [Nocardioides faecalis]MBS4754597.1 NAD(P)H-hydrate dehydratase [Nocardioides faecalis]